ncbi:N-acetylglucosamine kinase [soil metagenome]
MTAPFFLGVDGGGTASRARLTDAAMAVLGSGVAGPASTRFGIDAAIQAVMDVCRAALRGAGLAEGDLGRIHAGIGIAGIGRKGAREAFAAWNHPFASAHFEGDGFIACRGAHGGKDGGIIILGTGSVGIACIGAVVTQVGGYGFPISDEGSGADLGLRAVQMALRANDGRGVTSAFLNEVMGRFHNDPAETVAWMDKANATDYAALAPLVMRHANDGDPNARRIVQDAAEGVDQMARALVAKGAPRMAILGGLASAMEEWLSPDVRKGFSPALGDAVSGALSLAQAK